MKFSLSPTGILATMFPNHPSTERSQATVGFAPSSPERAFLQAFDEHCDAIFRFCYLHVCDREQAKELTQQTYECAWGEVKGTENAEDFRALLYRTANDLVAGNCNLASHDPFTRALAGVDEQYRGAVILYHVERMPCEKIAQLIGGSADAIAAKVKQGALQMQAAFA